MSVLIKNGRVVTAVDDYFADVFVDGEVVALIGRELVIDADTVIDASGKARGARRGGSPHPHGAAFRRHHDLRHLRDRHPRRRPRRHHLHHRLRGAVSSGMSTLEALDIWHAKAAGKTAVDYAFHMIITDLPPSPSSGNAPPRGRRGHELQALHGLPRGDALRRRHHLSAPCARRARTARWSACTRRTASSSTSWCALRSSSGELISPKQHALTRPTRLEAEGRASRARHRGSGRAPPSTSCISVVTTLSRSCAWRRREG